MTNKLNNDLIIGAMRRYFTGIHAVFWLDLLSGKIVRHEKIYESYTKNVILKQSMTGEDLIFAKVIINVFLFNNDHIIMYLGISCYNLIFQCKKRN